MKTIGVKKHGEAILTAVGNEIEYLQGWKAIAAYLKSAERTVKRWERSRRLPVHRVQGNKRDGIFAHPQELNEWIAVGKFGRKRRKRMNVKYKIKEVEIPVDAFTPRGENGELAQAVVKAFENRKAIHVEDVQDDAKVSNLQNSIRQFVKRIMGDEYKNRIFRYRKENGGVTMWVETKPKK